MSLPQDPTPSERIALVFAVAMVSGALLLALWGLVAQWMAA